MWFDLFTGFVLIGVAMYSLFRTDQYVESILRYQERTWKYPLNQARRGATIIRYMVLLVGVVFSVAGAYLLARFINEFFLN
jgi:hypothetical protein